MNFIVKLCTTKPRYPWNLKNHSFEKKKTFYIHLHCWGFTAVSFVERGIYTKRFGLPKKKSMYQYYLSQAKPKVHYTKSCAAFAMYTWNPNDPCFDWKGPCFEGLTFKNRGHLGSKQPGSFFWGGFDSEIWSAPPPDPADSSRRLVVEWWGIYNHNLHWIDGMLGSLSPWKLSTVVGSIASWSV